MIFQVDSAKSEKHCRFIITSVFHRFFFLSQTPKPRKPAKNRRIPAVILNRWRTLCQPQRVVLRGNGFLSWRPLAERSDGKNNDETNPTAHNSCCCCVAQRTIEGSDGYGGGHRASSASEVWRAPPLAHVHELGGRLAPGERKRPRAGSLHGRMRDSGSSCPPGRNLHLLWGFLGIFCSSVVGMGVLLQ